MSFDVVLTRTASASQYGQNIPEIHEPQNVEFMPSSYHPNDDGTSAIKRMVDAGDNNATPSRKSSRFMSAFTQFYGNDDEIGETITSTTNNVPTKSSSTADESFPEIKGRVESKLMSMWHNVKYGKY